MTETTALKGNDIEYARGVKPARGNDQRITGYKTLAYDFADDGVRFEVGKTYDKSESLNIGNRVEGFSFWTGTPLGMLDTCASNLDLLKWCLTGNAGKKTIRFAEVSSDKNDASQYTQDLTNTSKITIEREISFVELLKWGIKCSEDDIDHDVLNDRKRDRLVSSRDGISLSSSRYSTIFATSGNSVKLNSDGDFVNFFTIGWGVEIVSYGWHSKLITTGSHSTHTCYGNFSTISSIGKNASLTAFGEQCGCIARGENSYINVQGEFGKFEGVEGTIVQIADYNAAHERQDDLFARIGENNVKPDTLYTTQNGRFIEVEAANE